MDIVAVEVREVEIEFRLRASGDRAEVVLGGFEHLGRPVLTATRSGGTGDIKRGEQGFAEHGSTLAEIVIEVCPANVDHKMAYGKLTTGICVQNQRQSASISNTNGGKRLVRAILPLSDRKLRPLGQLTKRKALSKGSSIR
jgi:hypothetical protein